MTAMRIDGKAIAADVRARVKAEAAEFATRHGAPPGLAVVLVGDDPASQVYVRNKGRMIEEAGMASFTHRLPASASQSDVEGLVRRLNADDAVDGVLVQLPLPDGLDPDAVIALVDPSKDVDGLTDVSAGRVMAQRPGLRPCTPAGCVVLAKHVLGDDLSGKTCVVIGRSILVGKPAAMLFLAENCTVTLAHSRTKDLPALARTADILVAAVGRAEMVKGDWIKPGACVIDVGINRIAAPEKGPDGTRLVGDVAYDEAAQTAGAITPVPGAVGPMTIAMLLSNTLEAAKARRRALEGVS